MREQLVIPRGPLEQGVALDEENLVEMPILARLAQIDEDGEGPADGR